MAKWQPIETALVKPFDKEKWYVDGEDVLVFQYYHRIARYCYTKTGKGRWIERGSGHVIEPTHWMPLPEPPK